MHSQTSDLTRIHDRLTALEKQNRRLKQLGIAVILLIPALLLLMGQAARKSTVEANEFILKDGNGNTRARLRMGGDFWAVPQFDLLDEKGTLRVRLFGGTGRVGEFVNVAGISVFDEHGRERGHFVTDNDGAALPFLNVKGLDDALVRGEGIMVSGSVTVSDERGFQAILGQANLETARSGETHTTSAASLVLLGRDKNVIWKAP